MVDCNGVSILQCPICRSRLNKIDGRYCCEKKHSFDIAHNNYVNLLTDDQKKTKDPGDNKEMMESRRNFLNRNFYERFSNELNNVIKDCTKESDCAILDAGCGEGYYLKRIKDYLISNAWAWNIEFYGVDISKVAVKYAAKRDKSINFIVGSNFKLPLLDSSIDIILRNFAPGDDDEFYRVLKTNGILIVVTPGEEHLFGLKEQLYERARKHEIKDNSYKGFKQQSHYDIKYELELNNNEDIKNLISMTPYYWSVNQTVRDNIDKYNEINTMLHFNVDIYDKVD